MIETWIGQRVRLRAITLDDAQVVAHWESDPGLGRLIHQPGFPVSEEQMRQRITGWLLAAGDEQPLGIETLDGDLIGVIGLQNIQRRHGTADLHLLIGERAIWNQGYGTEASLLFLQFVFDELGYQKINLSVYDYNTRAVCLYEKLGFVREGVRRRAVFTGGRYYDAVLMGMTREEFHTHAEDV